MRILSQDGMTDVPYEMVALNIEWHGSGNGKDYVHIMVRGFGEKSTSFAIYSTEDKAKKAMEMLRTAYCGHIERYVDEFVFRAKNYNSRPELLKILNEATETVRYFQFPSDNELEG